jgi:hypothetical protein
MIVERGHDVGEKNHDPTIDVWSVPSDDRKYCQDDYQLSSCPVASYMDEVKAMSLPAEPYDVERLDRALFVYSSLGRQGALNTMRWSRLADFNPITVCLLSHGQADFNSCRTSMSLPLRAS